jgi:PIN domain nuclease of toxin-antitoxin system
VNYVLDTHILIWYFIGSKRLKKRAKEAIDDCISRGGKLLVPTIVLSEALDIAEKRKVEFDFQKMYRLICDNPAFEVVGFTTTIFDETLEIKDIQEIHDRIIVATARFYSVDIITKDKIIRVSGEVESLF